MFFLIFMSENEKKKNRVTERMSRVVGVHSAEDELHRPDHLRERHTQSFVTCHGKIIWPEHTHTHTHTHTFKTTGPRNRLNSALPQVFFSNIKRSCKSGAASQAETTVYAYKHKN